MRAQNVLSFHLLCEYHGKYQVPIYENYLDKVIYTASIVRYTTKKKWRKKYYVEKRKSLPSSHFLKLLYIPQICTTST